MQVLINGDSHNIPASQSLDRLLADWNINPATVVVELNGRIITNEKFSNEQIPADATIEIVHFVGGG